MFKDKMSKYFLAVGMATVGLVAGIATMASAQIGTSAVNIPATVTSPTNSVTGGEQVAGANDTDSIQSGSQAGSDIGEPADAPESSSLDASDPAGGPNDQKQVGGTSDAPDAVEQGNSSK